MQITLNGEPLQFDAAPTIAELLLHSGHAGRRVAVELNRVIIPRSEHAGRQVADGDAVEIVSAIGGG